MQALTYDHFGEPTDAVSIGDVGVRDPQPGEVRVRMLRSPIHNHDLATIRGVYGYKPKLPAVAGSELVGVIDAVGDRVSLQVGMRVAGIARGAWAQHAFLSAASATPIPDAIGDHVAAQLVAMPMSAIALFDTLNVKAGDWIAQNAANGAVGRILMRYAQASGVNIVNLVRRTDAAQDVTSHGAAHVIVTEEDGWEERARALTGGAGFARIVDSIAGAQSLAMQRLLAEGGELVVFGGLSAGAMKLDPGLMIARELRIRGFWMTAWMGSASPEHVRDAMKTVFTLAMKDELPLPIGGVYPLTGYARALRAAEKPGRPGKILFSA